MGHWACLHALILDAMPEELRCRACGHRTQVTRDLLRGWGLHVRDPKVEAVREALSRVAEKLVCSQCASREVGISTVEEVRRSAGDAPASQAVLQQFIQAHGDWLFPNETTLVMSFRKQVLAGRSLSPKQRAVLTDLARKANKRRDAPPRFTRG